MPRRFRPKTRAELEASTPGPENYSWILFDPNDPPDPGGGYSVLTTDGIDTHAQWLPEGYWWCAQYGRLDVEFFREHQPLHKCG